MTNSYTIRRITLICFGIISGLLSTTMAQQQPTLSLNLKGQTIRQVMQEIEQQSDYTFVFNETIPLDQSSKLSPHNHSLKNALNTLFKNTGILWKESDKHIILSKAKAVAIAGYITDGHSLETLIGASIVNLNNGVGTASNVYGYYTLQVETDSVELLVSYLGFNSQKIKLYANKDTMINIALSEKPTLLEDVTVYQTQAFTPTSGHIEKTQSALQSGTSTFAENDVLKSLHFTPGIQPGVEGTTGIYIRGGGPDQNLILIDGIPIYNTDHYWGILSVFNGDAVKKASVYKSGFPARYGGRLSSVLDVRFRDGDMKKFSGDFTVSLLAARINAEGPLIKGKTSFSFSARRSYIDAILRIIRRTSGDKIPVFYLYDMNAKLNHKFSDRSRLYISYYGGKDKMEMKPNDESGYTSEDRKPVDISHNDTYQYTWGNNIVSLRWNYVFNHQLFMNLTGAYTAYRFDYQSKLWYEIKDTYSRTFSHFKKSRIKDWQAMADFEWRPNNKHYIRFGGGVIFHQFSPEMQGYKLAESQSENEEVNINYYLNKNIKAREASLYAEDELTITEQLKANLGIHLSLFNVQKKNYISAQPRISLGYKLSERLAIKASYAKMNQYVNLLSANTISQPTDLWVPITKRYRPMHSHQFTAGVFADTKTGYHFTVEGFYKEMHHILEYKDNAPSKDAFISWEEYVEAGKGRVYGIELMAQKTKGRLTGWVGYTLSWNDRKFETINKGRRFPAKYDRRHNFAITGTYTFNPKVDLSASWVYAGGSRATIPLEEYQVLPGELAGSVPYINKRNNYQLSATHHLDLDLRYKYSSRKIWTLSVYNAYNRKNPYMARRGGFAPSGKQAVTEYSLFGIIPSLSFTYKFK